jgi:exportin-1
VFFSSLLFSSFSSLGTYLRSFLILFDQPDGTIANEQFIHSSLVYLIRISEVNDDEIFKTCLEFWNYWCKELYNADITAKTSPLSSFPSSHIPTGAGTPVALPGVGNTTTISSNGNHHFNSGMAGGGRTSKHNTFETVLHNLRIIMIDKMAKPEEVRDTSA